MYTTRLGCIGTDRWIDRPVAVVVGVWDPLLAAHEELFVSLRDSARAAGLASCVALLDPDPQRFLRGAAERPVYDDIHTRGRLIRRAGIDHVLRVHFTRRDLAADAAELFDALASQVQVAELWLGARQSFGQGPAGNPTAIAEQATCRGIRLVRLAPAPLRMAGREVLALLAAGRPRQAAELVGRPPVRRRPRRSRLSVAWRPGTYRAVALDDPCPCVRGAAVDVCVTAEQRGLPQMWWPDPAIRYLAFTSGPGEQDGAVPEWRP